MTSCGINAKVTASVGCPTTSEPSMLRRELGDF